MNLSHPLLAVSLALLLSACGKQEQAAPPATAPEAAAPTETAPMPPAAMAPEAPAPEAAMSTADPGKKVFDSVCIACHGTGVAGAPKAGDKADWGPRIAQGSDVLYKHALEGFTGKKGMMPPRGGSTTLSDAEVKAAVDHMVSLAK